MATSAPTPSPTSSPGKSEAAEKLLSLAASVIAQNSLPTLPFCIGLSNALFKAFLFGAYPDKLWLYVMVQFPVIMFFLVQRWYQRNYLLYFAEYCWVINVVGWVFLASEAYTLFMPGSSMLFEPITRLALSRAFFGVANGPLALSVLVLGNKLVLHDLETTGSFFIHFSPAVVSWTMRWRGAGEDLFALGGREYTADELIAIKDISFWKLSLVAYLVWWAVYGVWLLLWGHSLPERGWGSSSFKDQRGVIQKLTGISAQNTRLSALAYLLLHGTLCSLSIMLLPSLFWNNFYLHTTFLVCLLLVAIYRGASYYHYAFGAKIEKQLHKALQQALETANKAQ